MAKKSNRKADKLAELRLLFNNPELIEAGITELADYLHDHLTVDEIKSYKTWITTGELSEVLNRISTLRRMIPAVYWVNYKKLKYVNADTRRLAKLHAELVTVFKKTRPITEDRDVEKLGNVSRLSDKSNSDKAPHSDNDISEGGDNE
jgi:hypothetical protein